jgi:hypothetical protein
VSRILNDERERAYQSGHTAYQQADCPAAMEPLREAADAESTGTKTETQLKALAELQECEALLAAQDIGTRGALAEAALAYSEFVTKYPHSPLTPGALAAGQRIVADPLIDQIATLEVCDQLTTLETQQLIESSDTLAPLLLACGDSYARAESWAEAYAMYDRFRSEFPDHVLIEEVMAAYARTSLAEADATGAGDLPEPAPVGESGLTGGLVSVRIQNDSPRHMTIVFSGPQTRVEELEPCTECETYAGVGPEQCPAIGPVGEYALEPGTYDVVVKATSDSAVTPYRGTWPFESGAAYEDCFFLVTRSAP